MAQQLFGHAQYPSPYFLSNILPLCLFLCTFVPLCVLHFPNQTKIMCCCLPTPPPRALHRPLHPKSQTGPPGTGKTMAAKRLARTSGLDYAIMSGGDVAPLGGKAVTQLHELFNWAERSRRGLLLFIDEADAFLGKRGEGMSEGMRGALNALLFRTGDQSRDFAVVLATNRPGDLDAAVLDRMDEALEFPLPGEGERLDILRLYLDKYIAKAGTAEGGAGAGGGGSFFARVGAMLRYVVFGRMTLGFPPVRDGVNWLSLSCFHYVSQGPASGRRPHHDQGRG